MGFKILAPQRWVEFPKLYPTCVGKHTHTCTRANQNILATQVRLKVIISQGWCVHVCVTRLREGFSPGRESVNKTVLGYFASWCQKSFWLKPDKRIRDEKNAMDAKPICVCFKKRTLCKKQSENSGRRNIIQDYKINGETDEVKEDRRTCCWFTEKR